MIPPPIVAPCGCLVELMVIEGETTFVLTACAAGTDCGFVRWVVTASEAQGNRITTIDAS